MTTMASRPVGRVLGGFLLVSLILTLGPLTSPYWISYFELCPAPPSAGNEYYTNELQHPVPEGRPSNDIPIGRGGRSVRDSRLRTPKFWGQHLRRNNLAAQAAAKNRLNPQNHPILYAKEEKAKQRTTISALKGLPTKKTKRRKKIYSITVLNNITSTLHMNYTFPNNHRSSEVSRITRSRGANATPPTTAPSVVPWSLFMNIFTSENITIAQNSSHILQEQLYQIGNSYATQQGPVTLYYNTIHEAFDHDWMTLACRKANAANLTCTHLRHFEEAQEDVTLTAVHEYCMQHPRDSVVYLHPKGCFHPADDQNEWRRSMTFATTTKQCLESTQQQSSSAVQCDVCGLLLQPLPEIHYPGNIFTAKCEYISKLHAPAKFHDIRQTKHVEWHTHALGNRTLLYSLFLDDFAMVGVGRFEWEHWIGSHPDLQACDVSPTNKLRYWTMERESKSRLMTSSSLAKSQSKLAVNDAVSVDNDISLPLYNESEFVLHLGPRFNYSHDDWEYYQYWLTKRKDLDSPQKRMKSYFLLRGVVDRYWLYYDKVPYTGVDTDTNNTNMNGINIGGNITSTLESLSPPPSWIWSWFPDGELWRKAVVEHGRTAVKHVLPQFPEPAVFPYKRQDIRNAWARRSSQLGNLKNSPAASTGNKFGQLINSAKGVGFAKKTESKSKANTGGGFFSSIAKGFGVV